MAFFGYPNTYAVGKCPPANSVTNEVHDDSAKKEEILKLEQELARI